MSKDLTIEELAELEQQANNGELHVTQQLSLLAMARELVRLKSAMRWRESNRFRAELQGRPIDEFLADSIVLGWKDPVDPTTPKAEG